MEMILETVDKALEMHTLWYENLVRTLLCNLPLPGSVLAKDAHHKCDFGCWFYSNKNFHFHELPSFTQIGELHKTMHDSARTLCLKKEATGMAPEVDYDAFVTNLVRFRSELNTFRQRVFDTLSNLKQA